MKNFLAVIAGLAVVIVISTGLDFVMHESGVFSMDLPCTGLGGKLVTRPHG